MVFEKQKDENYTLISSTTDKLDATISSELKSIFVFANKEGEKNIIFDMNKTKYCDSSGLSSILVANRMCKNAGGSFILCGLQENVQKLIEISQLDRVLNITPTKEEAVDYLFMEQVEKEISGKED